LDGSQAGQINSRQGGLQIAGLSQFLQRALKSEP
jgi:hypothetical protein